MEINYVYFYFGFIFFTIHITGLLYLKTFLENKKYKESNVVNKLCVTVPVILRVIAFLCFTLFIKNIVNKNVYFILFILNFLWFIKSIHTYYNYYIQEYLKCNICHTSNILHFLVVLFYLNLFYKLF